MKRIALLTVFTLIQMQLVFAFDGGGKADGGGDPDELQKALLAIDVQIQVTKMTTRLGKWIKFNALDLDKSSDLSLPSTWENWVTPGCLKFRRAWILENFRTNKNLPLVSVLNNIPKDEVLNALDRLDLIFKDRNSIKSCDPFNEMISDNNHLNKSFTLISIDRKYGSIFLEINSYQATSFLDSGNEMIIIPQFNE
jgi:hypothetical protein